MDLSNNWLWVGALWLGLMLIAGVVFLRMRRREEALRRMWADEDEPLEERRPGPNQGLMEDPADKTFLGRWLHLAGYRSAAAPALFVVSTLLCVTLGVTIAIFWQNSGIVASSVAAAAAVPGGIGEIAGPVLSAGPWILCAFWALAPWMVVSSERKRRVRAVEQDLPTTLDLLATLSETGLAFDSALDKVILSQRSGRPLVEELKTFQIEVLSGIGRVECFRRFSRRIEVAPVSSFVAALVQCEQVGAGYSNVLRVQADDLRNRRREEANMLAQALTVKLVFPLVICFLPAIFVVTLGPIFQRFLTLSEGMTGMR